MLVLAELSASEHSRCGINEGSLRRRARRRSCRKAVPHTKTGSLDSLRRRRAHLLRQATCATDELSDVYPRSPDTRLAATGPGSGRLPTLGGFFRRGRRERAAPGPRSPKARLVLP